MARWYADCFVMGLVLGHMVCGHWLEAALLASAHIGGRLLGRSLRRAREREQR